MSLAQELEPEVSIAIGRDPALVRTVRLVAAAVARRADCEDSLIEEIRLAVGEACAVMIGTGPGTGGEIAAGSEEGPTEEPHGGQVHVRIQARDQFFVTVSGSVDGRGGEFTGMGLEPWALLRGLCETLEVTDSSDGTVLTMSWPL